MELAILVLGWSVFAALALGVLAFVLTSVGEGRGRPVGRACTLCGPLLGLSAVVLTVEFPGRSWVVLGAVGMVLGAGVVLSRPAGAAAGLRIVGKPERIDERAAVFHRFYRLEPDTPEFDAHYAAHPEQREFDDKVRSLPGLARPGGRCYDPITSPYQLALTEVLEGLTRDLEWQPVPVEGAALPVTPEEVTPRLKGFARYLGADLVGTTKLNPAYVYSHIGRSPGSWGAEISLKHTHAIVIASEMGHDLVRHAPDGAITTETTHKYFEVGRIALVVARYLNLLGYEARAHVDGNYRVLCGPVAVDAGLGELGRLGLLITPRFGPRVRLSVVTTNLPLSQDEPVTFGVQHFCTICKKCGTCCPSASIDMGAKAVHNGVEKWRSNQETCYRYWRGQGSDCGICIKVCPYSHPGTPLHNLVRWLIRRNPVARHVALRADDFLYGRRPTQSYPLPAWHARSDAK